MREGGELDYMFINIITFYLQKLMLKKTVHEIIIFKKNSFYKQFLYKNFNIVFISQQTDKNNNF